MNYSAHHLKVLILLNSAICDLEGMKALNEDYKRAGHPPAYTQENFDKLSEEIRSFGSYISESRKVVFRRWINKEYLQAEGGQKQPVPGTGKYEDEMQTPGIFHGWGVDSEEVEGGALNTTVAIVEYEDGEVQMVPIGYFKFVN